MSRLRAALRLLPRSTRSALVAVALIVGLGVASALSTRHPQKHLPPRRPGASTTATPSPEPQPRARILSSAALTRARQAAGRFIASYLRFAYGRAPALSVAPVSPVVRRSLTRGAAAVTPAELRRHPRVVSLRVVAESADLACATAVVEDGGVTSYAIRLALRSDRSGWVVSAVRR